MRLLRILRKPENSRHLPKGDSPRILLLQIAGIGDLLLATPALDALRERYPNARIDLLASDRSAPLLAGHPSLHEVYALKVSAIRQPLSPSAWRQFAGVIGPLQKNGYDALVSLHNVATARGAWTMALLMSALKAPLWVGRNSDGRFPLFDLQLEESLHDPVPEPLTKLRVVQLLGADPAPRPLSLPLTAETRARAKELLSGAERWAALMPGCEDSFRRWPLERFAGVAAELKTRGFTVAALGGSDDKTLCDAVADASDGISFAGQLSLLESAAVLQRCHAAVSNNTGTMHLAAAVSTPLVALFAPGHVARYRPWMDHSRVVVLGEEEGAVPGDMPASAMRQALQRINVQQVLEAVERLLAQPGGEGSDEGKLGGSLDVTL